MTFDYYIVLDIIIRVGGGVGGKRKMWRGRWWRDDGVKQGEGVGGG